jgi:vacuolar-type H+-ATPase catalytic subunit A/Vma1
MTDVWNLIYKCRRCGETLQRGTLFGDIMRNSDLWNKIVVHSCDETHVGICDLVGFQGENAGMYNVLDE